ncbi:MAG: YidC/Oxa1 family membrane protein insertase, partial [Clostridiales bacterium]|nr:YidC/Oxa1 family membrane protein insertase [Clostridiales bacterium]
LIKVVLMPLDIKNRKGMRKMAQIQPELNKLQVKYANDKQKLQQKQQELMRKERYNPMSGCLPMLFQMPILFAMFGAMRALANEQIAHQVFTFLSGEVPQYEGWLWVKNIWMADSLFAPVAPSINAIRMIPLDIWQKVSQTLTPAQIEGILQHIASSVPDFTPEMFNFSTADSLKALMPHINIALQAMPEYISQVKALPGWGNINLFVTNLTVYLQNNGFLILPIMAGLSQVLMTKLTPGASGAAPIPTGEQTGTASTGAGMGNFMKYFFPLFSVYITLTSNAGFALYWVVSNMMATAMSFLITRHFDKTDKSGSQTKGAVTVT